MTELQLDACLRLLAHSDRRQVLRQLRRTDDGRVTIDALVEQLRDGGSVAGDPPPAGGDALAVHLYHNHLPKLAEHDVVDFDPTDGTVRYRPSDRMESVLDALPEPASESTPRL